MVSKMVFKFHDIIILILLLIHKSVNNTGTEYWCALISVNDTSIPVCTRRAGLCYCGALCESDCVGPNLGRNKDNNYSRDKRGAFGSAGPTAHSSKMCANSFFERSFMYDAPSLWNTLDLDIILFLLMRSKIIQTHLYLNTL